MQVLDKKSPDFTDYTLNKKTADEKKEICEKYVRTNKWKYSDHS